jgi:hypothetical protein
MLQRLAKTLSVVKKDSHPGKIVLFPKKRNPCKSESRQSFKRILKLIQDEFRKIFCALEEQPNIQNLQSILSKIV